jgi:hypothetical protein
MKTFMMIKNFTRSAAFFLMLFVCSILANAQEHHNPNQDQNSHAKQSGEYLDNIEKSSGYSTPQGGEWYVQPWIWALVAAGLILTIAFIYKNNTDRDEKSEAGVGH